VEAYPLPKIGLGLHTIAFDLDGTLAEATWPSPDIGRPIPLAVRMAQWYFRHGYEVIIFTSRPASHREAIEDWAYLNGLEFIYSVVTDKPRAALYIDDRAIAFPEGLGPRRDPRKPRDLDDL
jgi:phosphoglycolate phosphatase-like HAD superfamily hydrolase